MVFHTWCTILYGVTYPDVCCTSLCYWSTDCFALINACVLCQTLLSVWPDTFMLSPCALKYSAHWTASPFCYPISSFSFWGSNEDFHVYAEQLWYILIDPYISAQHSLSSSPVNIVSKTCHTSHTKLLYFLGCPSIHILFCSACQLPCVTMAASHVQPALSTFFLIPLSVSFLSVLKQYQVFTWGWTCLWMKVCPWPVHWCRPATCLWMEACCYLRIPGILDRQNVSGWRHTVHLRMTGSVERHVSGWRHADHLHIPWVPTLKYPIPSTFAIVRRLNW